MKVREQNAPFRRGLALSCFGVVLFCLALQFSWSLRARFSLVLAGHPFARIEMREGRELLNSPMSNVMASADVVVEQRVIGVIGRLGEFWENRDDFPSVVPTLLPLLVGVGAFIVLVYEALRTLQRSRNAFHALGRAGS